MPCIICNQFHIENERLCRNHRVQNSNGFSDSGQFGGQLSKTRGGILVKWHNTHSANECVDEFMQLAGMPFLRAKTQFRERDNAYCNIGRLVFQQSIRDAMRSP